MGIDASVRPEPAQPASNLSSDDPPCFRILAAELKYQ
jgi:hypothetical protein